MKTALQRIENIYIKYIDQKKKEQTIMISKLAQQNKIFFSKKLLIRIRESQ